jgi:hypothetical protein
MKNHSLCTILVPEKKKYIMNVYNEYPDFRRQGHFQNGVYLYPDIYSTDSNTFTLRNKKIFVIWGITLYGP